ncbi:Ras guanine nucleotide exchange factor K [Parasponia andersonii]|uniref:Ras guanine nucleotide exchange factor K n=1 Tax=Parasponia andersonii TaxID=3476 RepID=A0A2P5DT47_PARAD|nr:Ras guanine nucleotide exchange factor K [Parasponia andersonii]
MTSAADMQESHTDLEFAGNHRRTSFSDPSTRPEAPLLLKPGYARSSKSTNILDELRHFRICLKWCALDHSTFAGKSISYFFFVFLTFIIPVLTAFSVRYRNPSAGGDAMVFSFNALVQVPESGLAAVGFLILSRFFRQYGLRQLLFLDGLDDDSVEVRRRYAGALDRAFRCLAGILLPSFLVELAHKVVFFSSAETAPSLGAIPGAKSVALVAVLASWVYRSGVFLLVCVLFRLTCELQILRFEGFQKLLEGCESSCRVIFQEHVRIRKQLWLTSHRYRFFIVVCLVIITVSQFGALLLVLASKAEKTFLNSGDLVVCSAVEISGFFLCLVGAARITHRAQRIVSIATRWHVLVTCASAGPDQSKAHIIHNTNSNDDDQRYGESDSDSSDKFVSVSPQDSSSFQTRQALVAYLEHNDGGITLFGFALDRGLLHTLFAFEFSLVLWILSKVVVLS